jgi:hypothetical protein
MAVDFDPKLATLISSGNAARPLLAALETFCEALVEESLKRLDRDIANGALIPEIALAMCHEIAAYRRIVQRLSQRVTAGERAEARAATRHQETTQ